MTQQSSSAIEPGTRAPAPGGLGLVQAFINTNDAEEGGDLFREAPRLAAWLTEHGLIDTGAAVGEPERVRVLEVRETLRALALANNGELLPQGAIERLNGHAAGATLAVRFDVGGVAVLRPAAGGVDGALARILGAVYTATVDGTWPRLKACRSDTCRWAFYDASKNRSGAWCSMAVCGNRSKVRAYQQRQRRTESRT